MGVECSCLQHRRRYPRRPSDDPTALEMDEFDLLMQSPASSTDDDDLLARGEFELMSLRALPRLLILSTCLQVMIVLSNAAARA